MWALRALLLGGAAATGLAYVLAAAAAVITASAGLDLSVALGPLVLVAVESRAGSTATTFGLGLAVIGLAGALANLVAARLIRRRGHARGRARDPFA